MFCLAIMLLLLFLSLLSFPSISTAFQCPNTSLSVQPHCPYFNNRPLELATPPLSSSSNCYWYRTQSCCTFYEAELVVGETVNNLFTDASVDCLDELNLLVCYVCSPNQSDFYQPGQLVICSDFCDRLFTSCSDAVWKGVTLAKRFDNSSHFCLSRGYTIGVSSGSCFNSATTHNNVWIVLFCLFISVLFGSNFKWKLFIMVLIFLSTLRYTESLSATDVQNWGDSLGSFTQSITQNILKVDSLQDTFNSANFSHLYINGSSLRDEMAAELSRIYKEAINAAESLANDTEQLFDANCDDTTSYTIDELQTDGRFYDSDTTTFSHLQNVTSVKIPDSVSRDDITRNISLTSKLTNAFRNAKKSSQYITRVYFGSVEGFLREYPGREWERDFIGFPKDYDPRLQSWYHVATSRPKDIVIVVDCSSSMLENDRWQLAVSTIEIILQTLTQEDFINIVCSSSSAYRNQDSSDATYVDARVLSPCAQDGLMPATSGVKGHLISLLKDETPFGGSDHRDAFTLAFKLLWQRNRECEPLIIFLTDGVATDPVLCRPPTYFGTEEGALFVPGPECLFDFTQVLEHVNRLEDDYTNTSGRGEIKIIGIALSETDTTLAYNISCSHEGFGLKVTDTRSIYSQLSPYFSYISQNTSQTILLNPYGDEELILTAVKSVYSQCWGTNRLIGVIGVDFSLADVQLVLSRARSENSYAFIINQFGEALFHPRIDPVAQLVPNPIHPPLSSLESCPNNSNLSICSDNPLLLDIEATILLNWDTPSSFNVSNVPRVTLRGDHQDGVEWSIGNSNYFYTPIPGTDYILGLNLEDSFLDQFILSSLPPNKQYPQPFYNIFSEYSQDTLDLFGLEPPGFCISSTTPFNISTNQSLIVLAPMSVCDPRNYSINNIPGPLTVYEYFSHFEDETMTNLFEGCTSENEFFRDRLLSSILLTSALDSTSRGVNTSGIVWQYIGLENGVLRILPGVNIGTNYDPTVRPWYRRAVAEKNTLAISFVYLDAGGAGKTVTFSRALFKGPPAPLNGTNCSEAGCHCVTDEECLSKSCIPELQVCSSNRIAGVTAFDFAYTEFYDRINSSLNSLNSFGCYRDSDCYFYIFDSQTFLILAEEFLDAEPTDTSAYERVSLGALQPEVVRDSVTKGLLVEEISFDFQSRCLYSEDFLSVRENNSTLLDDSRHFATYENEYSCLQLVRNFYINSTLLGSLNGTFSGTIFKINNCRFGDYFVSRIAGTNAFLLVLSNWTGSKECPLDISAQSGPTLNLTGGTQCPSLFSRIQLTKIYSCSTPIYSPKCDPISGVGPTGASSILIGLIYLLLLYMTN